MNQLLMAHAVVPNHYRNASFDFYYKMQSILPTQSVPPIDRTNTITAPVNFATPDSLKLGSWIHNTPKSYRDCCLLRAQEILNQQDRLLKPIAISYSGGIDSTAIICSFIQLLGLTNAAKRLDIFLTTHSIYENPKFFEQVLLPHFRIHTSFNANDLLPPKCILVTGDPNGNICGPEVLFHWSNKLGLAALTKPATGVNILSVFYNAEQEVDESLIIALADMVHVTAASVGVEINDILEWYWWYCINFRYSWYHFCKIFFYYFYNPQDIITSAAWNDHVFNFYDSKDFQIWSVNNRHMLKSYIQEGKWKYPPKQIIYDVMHDDDYLSNKGKVSSIQYMEFVFAKLYDKLLDVNYNMLDHDQIGNFLNEDNWYAQYVS